MIAVLAGLLIYAIFMWAAIVLARGLRYRKSPLSGKLEKNVKDILWFMDREFVSVDKTRVLEDYVAVLPEGETVSGERLEITDLKLLADNIFAAYYRQRFAGRGATGKEVRDSEYLRKHLRKRYIRQLLPGKKWRISL